MSSAGSVLVNHNRFPLAAYRWYVAVEICLYFDNELVSECLMRSTCRAAMCGLEWCWMFNDH